MQLMSLLWASLIILFWTECNSDARLFSQQTLEAFGGGCEWTNRATNPEVYYVNLDRSSDRKLNMEKHLRSVGLPFFRVRGLIPEELYIPDDIESSWRTAWCQVSTEWQAPPRFDVIANGSQSPLFAYSSIISGLCGRGKNKNTKKELGCTSSHLVAMRNAIYSTTSRSRYALIVEDDVKLPFDIDFDALAASAPAGFGILQLFNSNIETMKDSWIHYTKDHSKLWAESKNLNFWSTCAYLIDREVMKPVIDKVVYLNNGWLEFKIIAGIQGPCAPKECCVDGKFVKPVPCVWASFGYQADSYLYALTTTYMLSVPLISNGQGTQSSTFHQEHVEQFHRAAFRKQRQIMNEMISGRVATPAFARAACRQTALNETGN